MSAALAGAASRKRCLIVDDSRVVRMVARKILEGMAFETCEASDGKAALDVCRDAMPDVILLDWNMPVMTGIEFLRELRKTTVRGAPVVVLCTTENDVDHIVQAVEAGADEYIMKPFDTEILESKFTQIGLI